MHEDHDPMAEAERTSQEEHDAAVGDSDGQYTILLLLFDIVTSRHDSGRPKICPRTGQPCTRGCFGR